jgi:hypothetical protein
LTFVHFCPSLLPSCRFCILLACQFCLLVSFSHLADTFLYSSFPLVVLPCYYPLYYITETLDIIVVLFLLLCHYHTLPALNPCSSQRVVVYTLCPFTHTLLLLLYYDGRLFLVGLFGIWVIVYTRCVGYFGSSCPMYICTVLLLLVVLPDDVGGFPPIDATLLPFF